MVFEMPDLLSRGSLYTTDFNFKVALMAGRKIIERRIENNEFELT